MAKKKKHKKHALPVSSDTGSISRRSKLSRVLYLFAATLAAFVLLEFVISLEARAGLSFSIITLVYYLLIFVLFLAVVFLNRGFSKKELTVEMLGEDTPHEDAVRICEKVNAQKKLAKKVMLVLVPFVFAVFFDLLYLFYGDILQRFFSLFA